MSEHRGKNRTRGRADPVPVKGRKVFSFDIAECAACLIEAIVDAEHHDAKTGTRSVTSELRGEYGSFTLRQAVMNVAPAVEKLWLSLTPDEQVELVFDWEFCPLVISHGIDWKTLRETTQGHGYVELFSDAKDRILAHEAIHRKFGKKA